MNIHVENSNEISKIYISGRIGNDTVKQFENVVSKSIDEYKKIVIDFKEVLYINSAGLRVLLSCMKSIGETEKRLIIRNVCDEIMDLFKMTGFDNIMVIE